MTYVQETLLRQSENLDHHLFEIDCVLSYNYHLRRLSDYVHRHFVDGSRLEVVAAHIGLSPSRLSHVFVEKTGVPYSYWIRCKRVRASLALLERGGRSMLDVAAAVGYRNVRSFERAFKKTIGTTPSMYRTLSAPQKVSRL